MNEPTQILVQSKTMSSQSQVYISLGSNIGDREKYLSDAMWEMEHSGIRVVRKSPIYQTEAWGVTDQSPFLNQVIEVTTCLSPQDLLNTLKSIEKKLGREIRGRWLQREIDLDILYYNTQIVRLPHLTIPHLHVRERRFVLIPLRDIAGDFRDPQTSQSIDQILNHIEDTSEVEFYKSAI